MSNADMLLDGVDATDAFVSPVPGWNKPDWEGWLVGWQMLTNLTICGMLCKPSLRGLSASTRIKGLLPYRVVLMHLWRWLQIHMSQHTHTHTHMYIACINEKYMSKYHQCCFPRQGCGFHTAAVLCHQHSLSPLVHFSTAKLKWRPGRLYTIWIYERGTMEQRKLEWTHSLRLLRGFCWRVSQ